MRPYLLPLACLVLAAPLVAQNAPGGPPGTADPARVAAGRYTVDTGHTQILWQVDHLGFSKYDGQFGGVTGTLDLDPANLSGARVAVTIPASGLVTTVDGLTKHMLTPDFLDPAKYPTASFTSTKVEKTGAATARITGDLTLLGVTRPVTLDTRFVGAGPGMDKAKTLNIGFQATGTLKRSEFGMEFGVPMVSDEVDIRINAAFVRVG
ncbi:YceI family protein [Sphingosinicella rhizophila]|uniref:YceI family protein n=1 Tax=Sphingosinicella rhizophila TaxID=3050082 RepID=A0ABU3QBB2_9SPHN|nr:YceI family protein [Sphingosinicella sp. GR2756]MDT9600682.1 YceI family protein [Sphingosinicella sp. GR2756]